MRITATSLWTAILFSQVWFLTPSRAGAQITGQVEATISHSFIVSTKTLPAGQYTFRMEGGSDGAIMTVSSEDGKNADQFMVRSSEASSTPAHTELVFRRYGDQEFLSKVYESGNRLGVAVSETSKVEKQLQAQGQQATEHTEPAGQ